MNQDILIVDDNLMNLMLTSTILEGKGYTVRTAQDGIKAIEAVQDQIPSLILLDVMMPDMDGYEVSSKIKENAKWKEIPIIFLTANNRTEDVIKGFEAGGVDYVAKPFKSEELLVRVKNHLELAESRKTILEMNRNRDKIYSIIAHDIRSPLSGIQQTIDAIDQGYIEPNSDDFKEIISQLKVRTKDTFTLLNSLLQWTKIKGEIIETKPANTNIYSLVANCAQLLEANAGTKNITIHLHLAEDLFAFCDEVSVHTIFRNLISNAIKFTPEYGRIDIEGSLSEDEAIITVSDTGIGMTQETIHKIFEKQEHVSTKGTLNEKGTGLGLIMVKDFIKINNGKIFVKSEPNLGTQFIVHLPKAL